MFPYCTRERKINAFRVIYLKYCCCSLLTFLQRKHYERISSLNLWHFFADHVTVEMDFSKALNRLGETAIMREDVGDYGSDDIGAAFQKFSVVTKELSNLMKNLVSKVGFFFFLQLQQPSKMASKRCVVFYG